MKSAFKEVTIARTAVIAELTLAAPEAFRALGQWNERSEKLSTFVDRCRGANTAEIKECISKMKENGTLHSTLNVQKS